MVNQPVTGVEWVNSQANLVSWTKGVDDGLDNFDLELARLSADGIIFVAQNGMSSPTLKMSSSKFDCISANN